MTKLNKTPFTIRLRRGTKANMLSSAVKLTAWAGEAFYTTDEKAVYIYDGTNSLPVVGRLPRTTTAINYTALVTDYLIAITNTAAPRTITIPTGAAMGVGSVLVVKDESGGAATNNITVQPTSGTIDGAASKVINTNYGVLRVYSDGTNWFTG